MAILLKTIRELLKELPSKDAKLAEKFLKERNFEAIYDLVKSDIYRIEKSFDKTGIITNIKLDKLIELQQCIERYMKLIEVFDNSNDVNHTFYE